MLEVKANSLFARVCLVEEIPAKTKSQQVLIERIVRSEEVVGLSAASINMAHHDEEASALEMEVEVGIYQRIVANFNFLLTLLHGILSDGRTIVGSIILSEVAHVGTKVALQNLSYLESQIEV